MTNSFNTQKKITHRRKRMKLELLEKRNGGACQQYKIIEQIDLSGK